MRRRWTISRTFDAMSDEYFRERKNEIIEVGNKIIRYLPGKENGNWPR